MIAVRDREKNPARLVSSARCYENKDFFAGDDFALVAGGWPRQYTYPPGFHYITSHDFRATALDHVAVGLPLTGAARIANQSSLLRDLRTAQAAISRESPNYLIASAVLYPLKIEPLPTAPIDGNDCVPVRICLSNLSGNNQHIEIH